MPTSRSSASGAAPKRPGERRQPVELEVVEDHGLTVGGHLDVELDVVGADRDRALERRQRVLLLVP